MHFSELIYYFFSKSFVNISKSNCNFFLSLYLNSSCGYSNILSFKNINDEEITAVESFVRDELGDVIDRKCAVANYEFDNDNWKYFYGVYDTSKDKFRFMRGDICLMKELVSYIQNEVANNPNNTKINVQRKMLFNDIIQLPIGTYFGRKERTLSVKNASDIQNAINQIDEQKNLFEGKLKSLLETAALKVASIHPINEKIIQIVATKNNKIRANVTCVFCQKAKILYVQGILSPTGSCYWNLSNLKKHLNRHTFGENKNGKHIEANDSILDDDECTTDMIFGRKPRKYNILSDDEEEKSINLMTKRRRKSNKTVTNASNDSQQLKMISNQMLAQNLSNITAALKNGEEINEMKFILNGMSYTAKVSDIDPDGSCFFSATAHQLSGFKIDSQEHKNLTIELRNEVVKYIQSNFEKFMFVLKDRVYEHVNKKLDDKELLSEARIFVNACLPQSTCYGGTESMIAISELRKINFVTISENGDCYMATNFNENYPRTVFLAYRVCGSNNNNRNHYDTVTEIDKNILYDIAKHFNEIISKKSKKNINNNSIVDINDTLE